MRVALFYHSLISDWNHGNAHFLRGIAAELQHRGHEISIFEPADSWSRNNLILECGEDAVQRFHRAFPKLQSQVYSLGSLNLEEVLADTDLVIAHEWNDPALISAIGFYRKQNPRIRALFHDTHHRAVTAPLEMSRFDLSNFDGVLAYGASLADTYRRHGWGRQVFVWHEAADIRVFHPRAWEGPRDDVVWIGNWGDEERSEEIREFLLQPVRNLTLQAHAFGVRYPATAVRELESAGIRYRGWVPNYEVPSVFAKFKATLHIPRRPYTKALRGIPTIRPFEALACGIPLVSAPWDDAESLFRVGADFLMVSNGTQMRDALNTVLHDRSAGAELARNGLETIRCRHTCRHRMDELLEIYRGIAPTPACDELRDEVTA
jgi:spore maturation protein CgeB